MMDNKMKGALVALVGSLCMGGAQLMDMESRIAALEKAAVIEPESAEDEATEELSDEDQIEADEAEAEAQPLIEADEE